MREDLLRRPARARPGARRIGRAPVRPNPTENDGQVYEDTPDHEHTDRMG
ncbi:hypothetical protein GCM10020229_74770 [Kitasatospora albolonga]